MRKGPVFLVFTLILLTLTAAAGCGGSDEGESDSGSGSGSEGGPITIGAAVGLTGVNAVYDQQNMAAAQMAVDEINADGGVLGRDLKLEVVDTRSDREQSGPAALSAIEKGADFMITQCDYDFGAPAALVAQQRKMVAMSCAMSPKFGVQNIGPFAYTVNYSTTEEGAVAAEFSYKELGARTVYILEDTEIAYSQDVCTSFKQAWTDLAGEDSIVGEDTFQNPDPSIATQISRIRSADPPPDLIRVCSYLPGGASALKQIRAAGLDQPIFGSQAMADRGTAKALPGLSDYYWAEYGSIYGDDERAGINDFFDRFAKETGKQATNAYPLMGYSMVQAFAEGIKAADSTDGDAVRKALDQFEDVPLLAGPTTFTPELHINSNRPMVVMEMVDGQPRFNQLMTPENVPPETF
jgi:branched-chain amino acid transport system substrate-binding protein